MKTIGLIGGMSWESSNIYYQLINKRVSELLGDTHSSKCIMISVNFDEIKKLTFANDWEKIGELMADCAINLEKAGADMIVLCTNAIHMVSESIVKSISIPFIHIADAVGSVISQSGLNKVGLLGTKFTMEEQFYTGLLSEKYGLEIVIPQVDEREVIHQIIYDELVKGIFSQKSKEIIINLINNLQEKGIEGVILGCTELPILLSDVVLNLTSFDTTKIHAYKAVEESVKNMKVMPSL